MFTKTRAVLRSSDLIIAAIAIIAVLLAGCTSEDATPEEPATTTTSAADSGAATTENQDLVFGSGVLPPTVPADLPIPEQAVVGSTLVDSARGLTEAIFTYPADAIAVAEFYTTNLPEFGYVIDESSGTDARREISFSKDGLTGTIVVSTAGSGLSQGSLRLVTVSAG